MVAHKRKQARLTLSAREIRRRANRIAMVLTDNDGVLTDTGVYYSQTGEQLKRYSVRDGMGVELLRNAGIETGIITSEKSESLRRRAEKLNIRHVYLGIKDKKAHLDFILGLTHLSVHQIAYIGDDVNDIGILEAVGASGLTGAPADAVARVLEIVHYRCGASGGHGAFRDFAEWILDQLRGDRKTMVAQHTDVHDTLMMTETHT